MTRKILGVLPVLAAGAALATPPVNTPPLGPAARARLQFTPAPEGGPWTETFDSYAAGSTLAGQGGWAAWCPGGADGLISTNTAASAPNSFRGTALTDMVQTFNITSGKWVLRVKTYVPTGAVGDGYIVGLNSYVCNTYNWSITIRLSGGLNQVGTWSGGVYSNFLPLIRDQWVEYRAEIDLGADTLKEFYNNQQIGPATAWTTNIAAGGLPQIQALDLYSESMDGIYYDDCSLTALCYPDCNTSGSLTIADFGCFQAAFAGNNLYADCNSSGTLTIADFACFQAAFAAGCP